MFKGLGHLFEVNFNISYDIALLVMIVITGICLVLGGYFAIVVTDFIQGIIMIFGCVALIAILTAKAGGPVDAFAAIQQRFAEHSAAGPPDMLLLAALILLLILSASMSTLSGLVLVSASSVAIDLYKGHINPSLSKAGSVAMIRAASAVFVAISYIIARYEFAVIMTLMSVSWGVIAGAFAAPYIYGLFWRRATAAGALAGMLVGVVGAIALFFRLGAAKAPIAASAAIITPFIVVPLVSLFTRPPKQETVDRAFA